MSRDGADPVNRPHGSGGAAAAEGPARLDVAGTFPKGMVCEGKSVGTPFKALPPLGMGPLPVVAQGRALTRLDAPVFGAGGRTHG